MPRWFFVVVTLFGLAALASWIVTVPDPLGLIVGKLGEGGMWATLAVSVAVAAFLGFRPRKAGDAARPPRE